MKTTRTSFRILEGLADCEGAGVTELAEALALPKSTVHKHLMTLVDLGYLTRIGDSYHVGSRCLSLGARAQDHLVSVARPEVNKLALATGERASVLIEERGVGVRIYDRHGDCDPDPNDRFRRSVPLHASAAGKALLANISSARVGRIVERCGLVRRTSRTITDREALDRELQAIREQEVAFDRGEQVRGQRGVAAPVRGTDGTAVAAVEITGPVSRLDGKRLDEDCTGLTLSVATAIERSLAPG